MIVYILCVFCMVTNVFATPNSGAEIALILDTSCSMSYNVKMTTKDALGHTTEKQLPPNDPDRASILGALVIEGLLRNGADGYTVYFLPDGNGVVKEVTDAKTINDLSFSEKTQFKKPFGLAHKRLTSSTQKNKLFILLTDGQPEDLQPISADLNAIFGSPRSYSFFVIGLYQSPEAQTAGENFLRVLTENKKESLVLTNNPADVVPLFMEGFAKALGSKPEIGTVSVGTKKNISIPKYVTEVFIAITSDEPVDKFTSTVTTSKGVVSPNASGDNNCQKKPDTCRFYETYRIPHDPNVPSEISLEIFDAKHPVNYSVVYRYQLSAELEPLKEIKVGEVTKLRAKIYFQNQVFVDSNFFTSDHFVMQVDTGSGSPVLLEHVGNGIFEGTYIPIQPSEQQVFLLSVRNDWLNLTDTKYASVTGTFDFRLVIGNLDLGTWDGDGDPIQKCGVLDISQSQYADVVPLDCSVENLSPNFTGTCVPSPVYPVEPGKQPVFWDVCITSSSCCEANNKPADVWFRPKNAAYADKAAQGNVTFVVNATTFWNCFHKEIIGTLGFIGLMVFILGFIRPYNFAYGVSFQCALKQSKLGNTSTEAVEIRNGRKGFYRNARIAVDASGDVIGSVSKAVLVLEAKAHDTTEFAKADGLEIYNEHQAKWVVVPEEDYKTGALSGRIYRCQGVYFRFSGV